MTAVNVISQVGTGETQNNHFTNEKSSNNHNYLKLNPNKSQFQPKYLGGFLEICAKSSVTLGFVSLSN